MSDVDYRAAANSARQLVRQAIDLQGLQQVLDQLAGESASIGQLRNELAALQVQKGEAQAAVVAWNAKAHGAKQEAESVYAEQIRIQQDRSVELGSANQALEQRQQELTESVQVLEQSERDIRARLAAALQQ